MKQRSACALVLFTALLLGRAYGQAQQNAQNPPAPDFSKDPVELVRKAVANELKTPENVPRFAFRDVKERSNGTLETREMVETKDGLVLGRIVAINGKPLGDDQRTREDKRLQRLLSDPDQLAQKKKEQQEDERRIRRMVKALPDAFLYKYQGTEPAKNGQLVVLQFSPNPNFNPSSRELQVYKGMAGTLKIAVPQYRIALLEAKLIRDVNFGWGILGHLDRGGSFVVEQSDVSDGFWDVTHMVLSFTGKVLLLKSLNIKQDETTSNYRRVSDMSVAQAIDFLKKAEDEVARNADGSSRQ